ncbi:MAG: NAD(P)H-hydrate dehydratase, partial [Calditrichaeota bacterium]|nr:NAD(P)H-hydrate dehydratase [Calditrichota bacterium]
MEPVVSVQEMRTVDQLSTTELNIPAILLMENAGLKTAQAIRRELGDLTHKQVCIICGKGNNGGDGFVVGRHLSRMGARVEFFSTAPLSDFKGEAAVNRQIAERLRLPVHDIRTMDDLKPAVAPDLIVDALLGTGIRGEVTGLYRALIEWMNAQSVPIVAVDTPSGVNCETGDVAGTAVRATFTVTMGAIKTGQLFYPARSHQNKLRVADLNAPPFLLEKVNTQKFLVTPEDIVSLLPERPPDGYKNTFGKVLLIAGSTGLTGAATMASLSALRSGAGMAVLAIPERFNPVLEEKVTEVMTAPLPETEDGSIHSRAIEQIDRWLQWSHVLALGPGLSTHPETQTFVRALLGKANQPIVIDADGINNLAGQVDLIRNYPADLVFTPHVGELSRLIGVPQKDILTNRIALLKEWASKLNCTLLLKGAPTLIADPSGTLYFNPTGNAGMATAGSGDVLTGLIAGFLAQGLTGTHAAIAGAFVHGMAGDLARKKLGQRGMIAGDILNHVP